MKKSFLLAFLILHFQFSFSQENERCSVNSGGSTAIINDLQFSSTIGQPVIGIAVSPDFQLFQGFQQARVILLPEGTNKPQLLSYKLYPNPAVSYVNIRYEFITSGKISTQIYDIAGKLVRTAEADYYIGIATQTIPLHGLSAGSYMIVFRYNKKAILTEKLIIF